MANNILLEESLPTLPDYEGAITSVSTVRPDEIILKHFSDQPFRGLNAAISLRFSDGHSVDLPLHSKRGFQSIFGGGNMDRVYWTLFIPEKCYAKAEKDAQLKTLLKELFGNQRSLDVLIDEKIDQITVEPRGIFKRGKFKMVFRR